MGVFCKRKFTTFEKIFPQALVGNFYINLVALPNLVILVINISIKM